MLNPLASDELVQCTPSRLDGVPVETEDAICVLACRRIQQAGAILGLPQAAMATAQVLFRRFWFVASIKRFDVRTVSEGTLLLACKLVEVPLSLRETRCSRLKCKCSSDLASMSTSNCRMPS